MNLSFVQPLFGTFDVTVPTRKRGMANPEFPDHIIANLHEYRAGFQSR